LRLRAALLPSRLFAPRRSKRQRVMVVVVLPPV
jgi:hypothetical protein